METGNNFDNNSVHTCKLILEIIEPEILIQGGVFNSELCLKVRITQKMNEVRQKRHILYVFTNVF